jgi:hypothetical protein
LVWGPWFERALGWGDSEGGLGWVVKLGVMAGAWGCVAGVAAPDCCIPFGSALRPTRRSNLLRSSSVCACPPRTFAGWPLAAGARCSWPSARVQPTLRAVSARLHAIWLRSSWQRSCDLFRNCSRNEGRQHCCRRRRPKPACSALQSFPSLELTCVVPSMSVTWHCLTLDWTVQ